MAQGLCRAGKNALGYTLSIALWPRALLLHALRTSGDSRPRRWPAYGTSDGSWYMKPSVADALGRSKGCLSSLPSISMAAAQSFFLTRLTPHVGP